VGRTVGEGEGEGEGGRDDGDGDGDDDLAGVGVGEDGDDDDAGDGDNVGVEVAPPVRVGDGDGAVVGLDDDPGLASGVAGPVDPDGCAEAGEEGEVGAAVAAGGNGLGLPPEHAASAPMIPSTQRRNTPRSIGKPDRFTKKSSGIRPRRQLPSKKDIPAEKRSSFRKT
jgi:hypothetical protein